MGWLHILQQCTVSNVVLFYFKEREDNWMRYLFLHNINIQTKVLDKSKVF